MAAATQDSAVSSGKITRVFIYLVLLLSALFYLLPFFVMVVNSLKPLEEITGGNMMALPQTWTIEPWLKAWSTAQIGVEATGLKPYFLNSILMVVPAVVISTGLGALNGYVLTKWRFRGDTLLFGLLLFSCFIPFQIVLIPMATILGKIGLAGSIPGLVLVHVVYGVGFTTLYYRNYYAAFPTELVHAAMIDGAGFFRIFWRIMLPVSGPITVVSVIWQFTNVWNDFLFGASFGGQTQPMTVALNNLVQSSTGVKEYNVHFAGAILENYLGLVFTNGLSTVYNLLDDAPAGISGLAPGDVITTINGYARTDDGLRWAAGHDQPVTLGVIRGHRELTFTVTPISREVITDLIWRGDEAQAAWLEKWFDLPFVFKRGQVIPLDFYENFHGVEMVL